MAGSTEFTDIPDSFPPQEFSCFEIFQHLRGIHALTAKFSKETTLFFLYFTQINYFLIVFLNVVWPFHFFVSATRQHLVEAKRNYSHDAET